MDHAADLPPTDDGGSVAAPDNRKNAMALIAVMHELRAPVRVINGCLEATLRRLNDDVMRHDNETIEDLTQQALRVSVHLQGLTEDMMNLVRCVATADSFVPVNLTDTAHSVARQVAEEFHDQDPAIAISPLPTVRGVPSLMRLLFRNLLSNAIKYRSPDARPSVCLLAKRTQHNIRLSIRDNGIGIPTEQSETIFQPFQRLYAVPEASGQGLGLFICRHIVDQHKGRIWVQSATGGGSTFHIELPANPAAVPGTPGYREIGGKDECDQF